MNELIQLAESIGELAKLPETTQEAIQKQQGRLNTPVQKTAGWHKAGEAFL